jgi:putative membrane protein
VRALPVVAVAIFVIGPDVEVGFVLVVALLALLAVGVIAGGSYLSWQRFTFWFDDDGDLRVDRGVLTRSESRYQLSRLQSVDIVQPLLARLFGMAELRVEVAGAGESRASLAYLSLSEATALRSEILARAAGINADAGEAPEQVLHVVPASQLVRSLLLRGSTVMVFLITVVVTAVVLTNQGISGLALLLITGGVPLLAVFNEFTRYFDFTVAASPDGLRIRSGLLQTRAQTVPPGRVHAVALVEPFLWRRLGWIRVEVTLAAEQGGDGDAGASSVLLPVGTREEAAAVLEALLPGGFPRSVEWVSAPERARYRAPIQHRQLALARVEGAFLARYGWLTRHTAWVPAARVQSVTVEQGPWQRKLGLATVRVDTVPGPVGVLGLHRDAGDARWWAEVIAAAAARARASDLPGRWMERQQGSPGGTESALAEPAEGSTPSREE